MQENLCRISNRRLGHDDGRRLREGIPVLVAPPEGREGGQGGVDVCERVERIAAWEGLVPGDIYRRLRKLTAKSPWSTRLTMLLSLAGYLDAGLVDADLDDAVRVALTGLVQSVA